jgi:hypothetical protein
MNAIRAARKLLQDIAEAKARNAHRNGNVNNACPHEVIRLEARRNGPKSVECNICGDKVSGKSMHLDHNHEHGYIRGYLCHQCNTGLGMFKDSGILLDKAIKYLQYHSLLNQRKAG